MLKNIHDIQDITLENIKLLNEAGIFNSRNLLEVGGNSSSRKMLAEKTSISEDQILKWVNICDICRVIGVAGQFAELLESSGVDSINELGKCNAENLTEEIEKVNARIKLVKATPSISMVHSWIEQANKLQPIVTV